MISLHVFAFYWLLIYWLSIFWFLLVCMNIRMPWFLYGVHKTAWESRFPSDYCAGVKFRSLGLARNMFIQCVLSFIIINYFRRTKEIMPAVKVRIIKYCTWRSTTLLLLCSLIPLPSSQYCIPEGNFLITA